MNNADFVSTNDDNLVRTYSMLGFCFASALAAGTSDDIRDKMALMATAAWVVAAVTALNPMGGPDIGGRIDVTYGLSSIRIARGLWSKDFERKLLHRLEVQAALTYGF